MQRLERPEACSTPQASRPAEQCCSVFRQGKLCCFELQDRSLLSIARPCNRLRQKARALSISLRSVERTRSGPAGQLGRSTPPADMCSPTVELPASENSWSGSTNAAVEPESDGRVHLKLITRQDHRSLFCSLAALMAADAADNSARIEQSFRTVEKELQVTS